MESFCLTQKPIQSEEDFEYRKSQYPALDPNILSFSCELSQEFTGPRMDPAVLLLLPLPSCRVLPGPCPSQTSPPTFSSTRMFALCVLLPDVPMACSLPSSKAWLRSHLHRETCHDHHLSQQDKASVILCDTRGPVHKFNAPVGFLVLACGIEPKPALPHFLRGSGF